jgi:putative holliday junction resolvase
MEKIIKRNRPEQKDAGILIGIDFGGTNIGVALGRNGLVAPIKIISGKHAPTAIHDLIRIAMENRAVAFVMGLPLNVDGKETAESLEIRKFAKLLKIMSRLPVHFHTEYGTTQEALKEAIQMGIPRKKRKIGDHFSAAVILKRYYDESGNK